MAPNKDKYPTGQYEDEELVPFDVMDHSGTRSMRLLLIFLAVLLVAVIAVIKLYYDGTRDRDAPPKISAGSTPYKIEPENPGGEVTPNQDKSIYDVMQGKATDNGTVSVASTEQPMKLPDSANIQVKKDNNSSGAQGQTQSGDANQANTPARPFVVQVASVRSRAGAEELWDTIKGKYGDRFPQSAYAHILRTDLGDRGVYYRLRIAGFSNKDTAENLCEYLKTHQQACFVTRF